MAKSIWRRNDLIYMPRKKIDQGGKQSSINLGGLVNDYYILKTGSGVYANLRVFWLTPQPKRTQSLPNLALLDSVTNLYQYINFTMNWTTSSDRLYMLQIRPSSNDANIPSQRWVDPNGLWGSVVLQYLYLYVSYPNADPHIYRLTSDNLWDYRMPMHSSNYSLTNNNGTVRGAYADQNQFIALRDNAAIQDVLNGSNTYSTYFLYFRNDVNDTELLNLCEVYDMPGVTQVETLQI